MAQDDGNLPSSLSPIMRRTLNVFRQYRGTWGAANSASDLSPLTDSGRAALWVHGYIHNRIDMVRPN